jgi:hypothetical protein
MPSMIDGIFLLHDKRNGVGVYLLKDLIEASITVAEKVVDTCLEAGVCLGYDMRL